MIHHSINAGTLIVATHDNKLCTCTHGPHWFVSGSRCDDHEWNVCVAAGSLALIIDHMHDAKDIVGIGATLMLTDDRLLAYDMRSPRAFNALGWHQLPIVRRV